MRHREQRMNPENDYNMESAPAEIPAAAPAPATKKPGGLAAILSGNPKAIVFASVELMALILVAVLVLPKLFGNKPPESDAVKKTPPRTSSEIIPETTEEPEAIEEDISDQEIEEREPEETATPIMRRRRTPRVEKPEPEPTLPPPPPPPAGCYEDCGRDPAPHIAKHEQRNTDADRKTAAERAAADRAMERRAEIYHTIEIQRLHKTDHFEPVGELAPRPAARNLEQREWNYMGEPR